MSLVVAHVLGLCTVQDLGRRGHMHEAVPPGGALVPELLAAANRAADNPDDAPAIEVLGRLVVRATAPITVATARGARQSLAAGEELVVTSEPLRCTYLALRGGVAASDVLDGRGTLLCAGLGAPLRTGDALACAIAPERAVPTVFAPAEVIRIVPGPDLDAFAPDALAALTAAPYRILPTSDRVGTRLAGAALPRLAGYHERSRPMVRGAIEVPRDGQPIVLGPEHPTTGGYPILAVIAHADLGRFHAIRLGGAVRFG